MWHQIDDFTEDNGGDTFRTYASQVGSIGCLVMVVGRAGTPTPVFVPGVKLEQKNDKSCLISQEGFGGPPPSFESS